jgi:hypothetical protein
MHPIPLQKFVATLMRTPDEVWVKALSVFHKSEKHTLDEWKDVLAALKTRPAK